jgi:hypothetical protein
MMIEIETEQLDAIARIWLKETLCVIEKNAGSAYVHPDDAKMYKKDIKAIKRLLAFIGE